MKQFLRVDEQGYYIEPVLLELVTNDEGNEVYPIDEYMIEIPFPNGMHKPRWTGTEWIDEITQEELDEKRLQAKLEREREMLENPTEQMILGRQLSNVELDNMVLEQQVNVLKQQNMMLANLVIDMELKMIEQANDSKGDENV